MIDPPEPEKDSGQDLVNFIELALRIGVTLSICSRSACHGRSIFVPQGSTTV
jgi:hypothetical protein